MILSGQIALVTGASGPIGAAIADTLQQAGAKVARQYGRNRPDGVAFLADLSQEGFEADLLAQVRDALGQPDILVNCAADQALQPFAEVSDADMRHLMRVNVEAVLALSKAFVAQTGSAASIINISSIEARNPALGHGHYAASKAALESLTKSFAAEFGPRGVRCNAVAPGLIHRDGIETDWPEGVARWQSACPLSRLGTPQDVASAVLFLASPQAAWINGSILTIDGGVTAAGGW